MSIFQEIRETCAGVAQNSHWMSIEEDQLSRFVDALASDCVDLSHSEAEHLLGRGDDTLRFFVVLDTINFGSGYFPYLTKNTGASGYFTIARRLMEWIGSCGIPSAGGLRSISWEQCSEIFLQDAGNPHAVELMQLFALALRHLGEWLCGEFKGDYLGFLRTASTADEAVRSLSRMAFYRDSASHFGRTVHFYKRAQILLQDMKLAEPDHPLLSFADFSELTIFADNVLPYVFRADGLLKCHPWIEKRIDEEHLLGWGSTEEVELRACSVHLGEMIARRASKAGLGLSPREIDFLIWKRGQTLKKTSPLKRHRTRCVYY